MRSTVMVSESEALAGRPEPMKFDTKHAVFENDMSQPATETTKCVLLAMGCFWGAERVLWQQPGVITTAVGYAAGFTPNPTYEEVCTSNTGHTEVVRVIYDTSKTTLAQLLKVFFEKHDPTQLMRQGNDVGTQYRSGIYVYDDADFQVAQSVLNSYSQALKSKELGTVATEIAQNVDFYYAETYHQQYLHKNPQGYCGIGGTGVSCPI